MVNSFVKYPRTPHLPWSLGIKDDDKVIESLDSFLRKRIIVTEKMDGENTTMYSNHIHARSIDSSGGEDRAWVKQFWNSIAHDIPQGYRICGENLWAKHSIHYENLKSYFYGFSVWNENNICLSWDETIYWFKLLGITSVPVLYDGIWDETIIKNIWNDSMSERHEGYVVRVADSFSFDDFDTHVAKFVRANHVQTTKHWRQQQFVTNKLINCG